MLMQVLMLMVLECCGWFQKKTECHLDKPAHPACCRQGCSREACRGAFRVEGIFGVEPLRGAHNRHFWLISFRFDLFWTWYLWMAVGCCGYLGYLFWWVRNGYSRMATVWWFLWILLWCFLWISSQMRHHPATEQCPFKIGFWTP